jgi:hypothetical protein
MNPIHPSQPVAGQPIFPGVNRKLAAAAGLCALWLLSTPWFASASFDEATLPVGDVATTDGIVTGTVHIVGGRLVFYNGSLLEAVNGSLSMNFARGGSLILCPHSKVQILSQNQDAGMLVAFQEGGSQHPFSLRSHDVVMTPDWRIEMVGDAPAGPQAPDAGLLQLATSPHGSLCLMGNAKAGAFFRVSQLVGDASFDVPGQSSVRFADGKMESLSGGCACDEVAPDDIAGSSAPASSAAYGSSLPGSPASPSPGSTPSYVLAYPEGGGQQVAQPATTPTPNKKQHPQDVVGYMRSFIHKVFGR